MPKEPKEKYILIAEDDDFYASIYSQRLSDQGYETQIVSDGGQVLDSIKIKRPDLILLDIIIPVMDGFEVLSQIKADSDKQINSIKVLVLSNLGQQEDIEKAKSLGAEDYIVKSSSSLHDIIDKIDRVLGA